jgi:hypothetical protein
VKIYYQPSQSLVDYLQKELRSLQHDTQPSNAGDKSVIYTRQKKGRNKMAKAKYDAIGHIFKAFADIVYFLEFIEDHEELRDFYDRDLKDLFGINEDSSTRKYHFRNPGGPFSRLLSASLFYDVSGRQSLDFRMELVNILLNYAIRTMQRRFENVDEEKLMSSDASRVLIWSRLLASKVHNDKNNEANRGLGFHPYRYR